MKILVAYDGTLHAKNTLKYGIETLRQSGGSLTVLHVFNNVMFIDHEAGLHAEETARREAAGYIKEAKRIIEESGQGLQIKLIEEEGDPLEELTGYAKSAHMDVILAPPRFKSLAKKAACPVSIIPGTILVPVDHTESILAIVDKVINQARSAGSKVLLLGIVPVHLYSKAEKEDLEIIKRQTSLMIDAARSSIREAGIETKELIRAGYPDEEILKAADEQQISMIIIPDAGESPSEISKAGVIISEGCRKLNSKPLVLVPAA